jgi:hypothetical protein
MFIRVFVAKKTPILFNLYKQKKVYIPANLPLSFKNQITKQ